MEKLRTLIKKGRVIFIAFDNEVLALADPEAATEILGDASNEK